MSHLITAAELAHEIEDVVVIDVRWTLTTADRARPPRPSAPPEPPHATLSARTEAPPTPGAGRHAHVDVKGRAFLCNRGHFGVPIHAGREYVLTLMLRRRQRIPYSVNFGFDLLDPAGNVALTGLDPNVTYAVSIAALNERGLVSSFSNEQFIGPGAAAVGPASDISSQP